MNVSLACKFISLCCCCLASYGYVQPVLVFYPNWIRILIPSFVSGYIIVNFSEISVSAMGRPHTFIETVFAGLGCIVSFICGVFEIYQWASWFSSVVGDARTIGWQELILAISCLINAAVLLIDFVHYAFPWARQALVEDPIDQRHDDPQTNDGVFIVK